MFTFNELITITKGTPRITARGEVCGVSTDTRTIHKGDLFIAIKGEHHDGHDHILDAIKGGARVIMIRHRRWQGLKNTLIDLKKCAVISVADPQTALGDLAGFHRRRFTIPVIAITGSAGKTTTKDILATLFGASPRVLKSTASFNNRIGLPLTLLRLTSHHRYAVVEMGTSSFGQISDLCRIACPTDGIITSIGPAHLEGLGSVTGVFKAKRELYDYLRSIGGRVFINADDEYLRSLSIDPAVIRCGLRSSHMVWADQLKDIGGITLFRFMGTSWMAVRLRGAALLRDTVLALAVARYYGVKNSSMRQRLAAVRPGYLRGEQKTINGIDVYLDCYNANPLSMRAALEGLRLSAHRGKTFFLAGDMLELGSRAAALHQAVGRAIASSKINRLITVGDLAQDMNRAAQKAGMSKTAITHCATVDEAGSLLAREAKPGDRVLVKGSRALHLERVTCFITSSIR